jgi:regulator of sigma E protease
VTGDRIAAIGGRSVDTFDDLYLYVSLHPHEQVRIDYNRAGQMRTALATLGLQGEVDRFGNRSERGLLGVKPPPESEAVPVSVADAPLVALRRMNMVLRLTADTLGQLVTGRRPVSDMTGPVGMAQAAGERITLGWAEFVSMIVLVSINLGFINLLPVPLLDGGHLFFYAIEAVRRRPVGPAVQEWAFRGGLAAVLALMLVVTISDLGRLGLWRDLFGLIG